MESKLPKIGAVFDAVTVSPEDMLKHLQARPVPAFPDVHISFDNDAHLKRMLKLLEGGLPEGRMFVLTAENHLATMRAVKQLTGRVGYGVLEIDPLGMLGGDFDPTYVHAHRDTLDSSKYHLSYDFDILDELRAEHQELQRQREASQAGWSRKVKHHHRAPISTKTGNPSNLMLQLVGKL